MAAKGGHRDPVLGCAVTRAPRHALTILVPLTHVKRGECADPSQSLPALRIERSRSLWHEACRSSAGSPCLAPSRQRFAILLAEHLPLAEALCCTGQCRDGQADGFWRFRTRPVTSTVSGLQPSGRDVVSARTIFCSDPVRALRCSATARLDVRAFLGSSRASSLHSCFRTLDPPAGGPSRASRRGPWRRSCCKR